MSDSIENKAGGAGEPPNRPSYLLHIILALTSLLGLLKEVVIAIINPFK